MRFCYFYLCIFVFWTSSLTENASCRRHIEPWHIARNLLAVPQARLRTKGDRAFSVEHHYYGMTWLRISDSKLVSSLKSLLKIHFDGKLLLKSIIRAIWKHFIHSIIIIILWWAVFHNFLTFLSKTMNRLIDNENKRLLQPYWKVCDSVLSRVFNLTWVLTGLRLDWDY